MRRVVEIQQITPPCKVALYAVPLLAVRLKPQEFILGHMTAMPFNSSPGTRRKLRMHPQGIIWPAHDPDSIDGNEQTLNMQLIFPHGHWNILWYPFHPRCILVLALALALALCLHERSPI